MGAPFRRYRLSSGREVKLAAERWVFGGSARPLWACAGRMWKLRIPRPRDAGNLQNRQDVRLCCCGPLVGGEGGKLRPGLDAKLAVDRRQPHFDGAD